MKPTWTWLFALALSPAAALAQTGERPPAPVQAEEATPSRDATPIDAPAVAVDAPQPVSKDHYTKSEDPPGPNEGIPVRKDFQPELRGSLLNVP